MSQLGAGAQPQENPVQALIDSPGGPGALDLYEGQDRQAKPQLVERRSLKRALSALGIRLKWQIREKQAHHLYSVCRGVLASSLRSAAEQAEYGPTILVALSGLRGSGKTSQLRHLPITLQAEAEKDQFPDHMTTIITESMRDDTPGGPLVFQMDLETIGETLLPDPNSSSHSALQAAAMLLLAAFLTQRLPGHNTATTLVQHKLAHLRMDMTVKPMVRSIALKCRPDKDASQLLLVFAFDNVNSLKAENMARFRIICSVMSNHRTRFGRGGLPHVIIMLAGSILDPRALGLRFQPRSHPQAAPTHLCLLSPSQIQDTAKDLLVRLDLLQEGQDLPKSIKLLLPAVGGIPRHLEWMLLAIARSCWNQRDLSGFVRGQHNGLDVDALGRWISLGDDALHPDRVQGVAKRYCDFLLSPSSAFHMERMNAWLNGVKTMTLLKHIVACDLAGVLVTPSDAPPCGSHLSWDFLQSAGVLSLEPVWTFPKGFVNGEPVKVVVPLSTIIGLLQHDENQHCPASFDLPLKHWASMEETWNSEERSDLHALVSRLAALNFIGRRVICLSLLIGLQLDLVGLEWETRIMVPEDGYDTESRVLDDSMSEQEFLQWSQCEGSHAGLWWLFGASQASRPDWLMRLPLADGTGNLVLQGQSKRVQPPDRRHLTDQAALMLLFEKSNDVGTRDVGEWTKRYTSPGLESRFLLVTDDACSSAPQPVLGEVNDKIVPDASMEGVCIIASDQHETYYGSKSNLQRRTIAAVMEQIYITPSESKPKRANDKRKALGSPDGIPWLQSQNKSAGRHKLA